MFIQLQEHLDECPADFEDLFFLQLPPDHCLQIMFQRLEHAVEGLLIFDDLPYGGDGLDFVVIHQRNVLVLEYLLPGGLVMQLFNNHVFPGFCVLSPKEGVAFGFGYLFVDSILLHNFIK